MAKTIPSTPVNLPPDLQNVTVRLELVTQEIAHDWLENSPKFNRGIGKRVVARYANDMIEDRWLFTGESIIFDKGSPGKERMLDGWHRVTAIDQSAKEQWCIVVRGVDPKAIHRMDHGRGRVFRDTLTVLEVPSPHLVAPATNYLASYFKAGRRSFSTKGTLEHEKWETYVKYEASLNELSAIYNRKDLIRGVPPSLLSAVHIVLREKDVAAADEFMELLVTGDDLQSDHPITQFRHLVRKHTSAEKPLPNLYTRIGATILKVWLLYRADERVSKLTLAATTPEI
jgi:hypothetical protein